MQTQLISIAGPRKGKTVPLGTEDVSIGRSHGNTLWINSHLISRRHCLVRCAGERFTLVDMDSLNGTFVNGVPVKERDLAEGDLIAVGDTILLFTAREAESGLDSHTDSGSMPGEGARTKIMPPPEPVSPRITSEDRLLQPERIVASLQRAGRLEQDLEAVLKVGAAIGSAEGLESLQEKLLEAIFQIVPAESGAVLLVDETTGKIASMFGRSREWDNREAAASRNVVNRVLESGEAFLGNDLPGRPGFAAESPARRLQAALAVPLVVFERVRGVIYVDTADAAVRFENHHLHLMSAIGSMAVMPLENARQVERLRGENERLQREIDVEHDMVGESGGMRRVYQFISKVAPTESTVLILGESGTGKELVARAIHKNSPRAGRAFLAINCATLTEGLLESELFGHERGAFTGAIQQKQGKLEVANHGTVFLDEIGELAPQLQAKLLRVLQEHRFERVGGTRPIDVDIRLIAATNRNLKTAVSNGAFREDLFFRLNVVSIQLPPLRERRDDILLLAQYFLSKHSSRTKRRVDGISRGARDCLLAYNWVGNVRELENAIERAVVLGSSELLLPEDLPEAVLEAKADKPGNTTMFHDAVNQAKRSLVLNALKESEGNFTRAATLLGLHTNSLHRLIRNLDLRGQLDKKLA